MWAVRIACCCSGVNLIHNNFSAFKSLGPSSSWALERTISFCSADWFFSISHKLFNFLSTKTISLLLFKATNPFSNLCNTKLALILSCKRDNSSVVNHVASYSPVSSLYAKFGNSLANVFLITKGSFDGINLITCCNHDVSNHSACLVSSPVVSFFVNHCFKKCCSRSMSDHALSYFSSNIALLSIFDIFEILTWLFSKIFGLATLGVRQFHVVTSIDNPGIPLFSESFSANVSDHSSHNSCENSLPNLFRYPVLFPIVLIWLNNLWV